MNDQPELYYQPLALKSQWADSLRDTYWRNPTMIEGIALFFLMVAICSAAVALA
jgi:hypothetical protein